VNLYTHRFTNLNSGKVMRIRIDEIPDAGRFLRFHWDESRLRHLLPPDDPMPIALERPVEVDLEIHKRPDHIRVTGKIQAALQIACHRCLEIYSLPLEQQVDAFLVKTERKEASEEDLELEAEELEYEFFDGEVIDIDFLVAEQIFLVLPLKALCAEECKGICPRCGANLNVEVCSCPKKEQKSPFAGLRAVKLAVPDRNDA
jgi:uncharacterized protein